MIQRELHQRTRNQSMELAKFIAAIFVIWIHAPFPGKLGEGIVTLGRFAVPMFFCITGYFNYGASTKQIWRRTLHTAGLYLIAVMAECAVLAVQIFLGGGGLTEVVSRLLPDRQQLVGWLLWQENSLGYGLQLWYIEATVILYLGYLAYTWAKEKGGFEYKPLYTAGALLMVFGLGLANLLPMLYTDEINTLIYRNVLFTGIPFFTAGIFLRANEEAIQRRFSAGKLLTVYFLGEAVALGLSCLYSSELYIGTAVAALALVGALAEEKKLFPPGSRGEALTYKCGGWSVWMYLFHYLIIVCYDRYLWPQITAEIGNVEQWIKPVIILLLSWLAAVACRAAARK